MSEIPRIFITTHTEATEALCESANSFLRGRRKILPLLAFAAFYPEGL